MMRTAITAVVLAACADGSHTMTHVNAAPSTASARANGLELSISGKGAVLHVVLTNQSEGPLRLLGPVDAPPGRMWDFLKLELTGPGGATRTLRLTGDRNTSTTGVVDLAPGASITDDVDLAAWAKQPINGGAALATGDHAATATYALAQAGMWKGSVTAGPITIHAP